ncbi:MAG: PorT family protein [Bacteroidota bacterium]|nr:PorT family protein [Bacteroidota bacterium]
MTKRIVVLIIPVLFALTCTAQEGPIAFGIKGGLNLSSLNIDDPDQAYDMRAGFHAGLFLRGRFDAIAIQPELLLSVQNGDLDDSFLGTAKDRFTYLTIPLMFKFYPIGGLNIQLGPQFAFLLDGERKYDSFLGSGSIDISDEYKNSDVAVSFGAGYDFDFGLGLDFRYNIGIKDINDAADGEKAHSRMFMISAGWNFLR